jgi:hypothetical protein
MSLIRRFKKLLSLTEGRTTARAVAGGSIVALGVLAVGSLGVIRANADPIAPALETGAPTTDTEGRACASGIAVDAEVFGFFCTNKCTRNSDCPESWSCRKVWQGGAPPVGLCRPNRLGVGNNEAP